LKPKLSKKRAISTVLTTVIILVASVVLAAGVVLYGTSLFQGGTQQENISISGTKIWVHPTATDGLAWGATGVRNTGDKVVAGDKIQIRGADIPFAQWYPAKDVSSDLFQQALNHTGWSGTGGFLVNTGGSDCDLDIDVNGGTEDICADQTTGPVSLTPGHVVIIYYQLTNGTITPLDSGASITVSVFAGKAGGPQSITVRATP